jgi:hypothetical protein
MTEQRKSFCGFVRVKDSIIAEVNEGLTATNRQ